MPADAILVPLSYVIGVATPVIVSLCGAVVTIWKFYTGKASIEAETHLAKLEAAQAGTMRAYAESEAKLDRSRAEHAQERELLLRAITERDERRLVELQEAFERERKMRDEHLWDVKSSADALALQADMVEMLREATEKRK